MSKSIVTTNFEHEEKRTIQEYIEHNLYDNGSQGIAEAASNNAEKAQKGLSILCQILSDRGFLITEDIVSISDTWEQECKLIDE